MELSTRTADRRRMRGLADSHDHQPGVARQHSAPGHSFSCSPGLKTRSRTAPSRKPDFTPRSRTDLSDTGIGHRRFGPLPPEIPPSGWTRELECCLRLFIAGPVQAWMRASRSALEHAPGTHRQRDVKLSLPDRASGPGSSSRGTRPGFGGPHRPTTCADVEQRFTRRMSPRWSVRHVKKPQYLLKRAGLVIGLVSKA